MEESIEDKVTEHINDLAESEEWEELEELKETIENLLDDRDT